MPIRGFTGNPAGTTGKPGHKGGDAFVMALGMGLSVPAACKQAGIGTSTGYRRLEDPAVRQEVSRVRDRLLGEAGGRLLAAAGGAVGALVANLGSECEATVNRAAVAILAHMLKGVETVELARRVQQLEDQR